MIRLMLPLMSVLLSALGLAFIVVAAFLFTAIAGFLTLGAACLLLAFYLEQEGNNAKLGR